MIANFIIMTSSISHMQGPSFQTLATVLHQIETITYNITEDVKEVLIKLEKSLKELYSGAYSKLPNMEGLVLRTSNQ